MSSSWPSSKFSMTNAARAIQSSVALRRLRPLLRIKINCERSELSGGFNGTVLCMYLFLAVCRAVNVLIVYIPVSKYPPNAILRSANNYKRATRKRNQLNDLA